jgi:hypothetical protein
VEELHEPLNLFRFLLRSTPVPGSSCQSVPPITFSVYIAQSGFWATWPCFVLTVLFCHWNADVIAAVVLQLFLIAAAGPVCGVISSPLFSFCSFTFDGTFSQSISHLWVGIQPDLDSCGGYVAKLCVSKKQGFCWFQQFTNHPVSVATAHRVLWYCTLPYVRQWMTARSQYQGDTEFRDFYTKLYWLQREGKGKGTRITGHGGPKGCESSRLPHFLDSQLTDGSEVVSLKRWLTFIPRKIPCTHFC